MKNQQFNFHFALIFVAIVVFSFILSNNLTKHFADLDLSEFNAEGIVGLLGSLFFLTLLVERFVEIFVSDPDAPRKEILKQQIANLDKDIELLRNNQNVLYYSAIDISVTDKPQLLVIVQGKVADATKELNELRVKRRPKVIFISYLIGLMLALFGVRIVTDLVSAPIEDEVQLFWISMMDMVLTATIISGGSEGIHELIKIIRNGLPKA